MDYSEEIQKQALDQALDRGLEVLMAEEDLAEALGASQAHIADWRKEGRLPAIQVGKRYLFPVSLVAVELVRLALKNSKGQGTAN